MMTKPKLTAILSLSVFLLVGNLPLSSHASETDETLKAIQDELAKMNDRISALEQAECPVDEPTPEIRTSTDADGRTHAFTKVNHETLGEGWRDPSELTWFDRAEDHMNQRDAEAYCQERGGRLPTKEEFEQLGLYMGVKGKVGDYNYQRYRAQVLPNLEGRYFWSSSVHPVHSNFAYLFYDDNGVFDHGYRDNDASVRCVARLAWKC